PTQRPWWVCWVCLPSELLALYGFHLQGKPLPTNFDGRGVNITGDAAASEPVAGGCRGEAAAERGYNEVAGLSQFLNEKDFFPNALLPIMSVLFGSGSENHVRQRHGKPRLAPGEQQHRTLFAEDVSIADQGVTRLKDN